MGESIFGEGGEKGVWGFIKSLELKTSASGK
jgi:hypothetical protein